MHADPPIDDESPTDAAAAAPSAEPPVEAPVAAASEAAPEAAEPADAAAPAADARGLSPQACGAQLAARFPALFVPPDAPPGTTVKPIKLRIHADILERAPGVFSKRVLGVFFSRYTTSNAYLKALAAPGAQRCDLDGQPAGDVAEEHRAAAVEELARRQAIAAERRAAQRRRAAPVEGAASRPAQEPGERGPQQPQRPPRRGPHAGPRPQRDGAKPREPARRHDMAPRQPLAAARPASPPPPPSTAPMPPLDPAQRERELLLRAYESSPLSKANFCALKRISEAELDQLLARALAERRR